jgi:probable HAF family extracellular repeat protein
VNDLLFGAFTRVGNKWPQSVCHRLVACYVAILLVPAANAFGQGFNITQIGTLGGEQSLASGVNNRGDVVGSSFTAGNLASHTFVYRKGVLRDLHPFVDSGFGGSGGINNSGQIAGWLTTAPGAAVAAFYGANGITVMGSLGGFWAVAEAVNNVGQLAGWSYLPGNANTHAFLYSDGVMTDIGLLGHASFASGLNDFGVVVGGFIDDRGASTQHAFVYRDGVMSELDPFNGTNNLSMAVGINNVGQVIGWGLVEDNWRGFVEFNGAITELGSNYFPYSINESGQIVGDYCAGTSYCIEHPFLYTNGTLTDLNDLIPRNSGWELLTAFDINDRGQIVGHGIRDGKFRAYLLTPESKTK